MNVCVFDIGSICIHGKELLGQFTFHQNTGEDLTLKQMFDISEKLIVEQSDEIFGVTQNQLGNFSMETIISGQWWRSHQCLACKGLCILRFCVMSWKGESKINIIKYCLRTTVGLVQRFTTIQNFGHNWRRTDGIRVEHFPRFHYIAARRRSPKVHEQNEWPRSIPRTNFLHVVVQWHYMVIWRQWTGMYCQCHACVCICQKIPPGRWSFLGLGSEKKWYSTYIDRPRGEWGRVAELIIIKFWECGHPVFRATRTLQSRGGGKLSIHFCAELMDKRFKLFFAQLFLLISSVSTEQSQICVMNTVLVKQERGDKCWQDNLTHCSNEFEKLSQQDGLSKFCTDAGFLTTVEVGQYFMTKDTEEFSQFTEPVTCREYSLPRDEESPEKKGWIRGNTKIGHVLEVATSYLQGKYGEEMRIESVNKDNSHSWVTISQGLNKLVTNLNNKEGDDNEHETAEMEVRRICVENECICFCEPIKGKNKTTKTYFCLLIHQNCTYLWKILDWCRARNLFACRLPSVKTTEYSSSSLVNYLEKKMERLNSGDWKIIFGTILKTLSIGVMKCGRVNDVMTRHDKKFFTSELFKVIQDAISFDPTLQDNVLIPNNFFEYICHVGCAISLHSITNSGLIAGGQNSSRERQTVFFTVVNPME